MALIAVQWLIESNDQIKSASYLHEKWLKRTITWKYACIAREAVDSLYGQKELKNLGWNSLISRTKQDELLHGSLPTATIITPLFACVRAVYSQSVFKNSKAVQRPVSRRRYCNRQNINVCMTSTMKVQISVNDA